MSTRTLEIVNQNINKKFDIIVESVSGIAKKVANVSPWYTNNIPCDCGEDDPETDPTPSIDDDTGSTEPVPSGPMIDGPCDDNGEEVCAVQGEAVLICSGGTWRESFACSEGELCEEADCVADPNVCVPSCSGMACGDDGCGGSCGDCEPGLVCGQTGQCQPADNIGHRRGIEQQRGRRQPRAAAQALHRPHDQARRRQVLRGMAGSERGEP